METKCRCMQCDACKKDLRDKIEAYQLKEALKAPRKENDDEKNFK